jgi:hypothetical protein
MPYLVTVGTVPAGSDGVELPNGQIYQTGATVVLTDDEVAAISPHAITSGQVTVSGTRLSP